MEKGYALRTQGEMYIHVRDTTSCRLVYRFDPFVGNYYRHLQGGLMRFFETLVLACQSTRRQILEEGNIHQHHCDNLGSRRVILQKYYYLI